MFKKSVSCFKVLSGATLSLLFGAATQALAANNTWNIGNGSAWLTKTNWANTGTYPGVVGSSANTDIATFLDTGTNANIGINMNTAGGTFSLGALEMSSTFSRNFGNSATTGSGTGVTTLRLNGATVNGVNNVIVRNGGTGNITIQWVQAGTMRLALGNTANVILLDGANGGVAISSNITEINAGSSLTMSGTGSGALTLSGSNSYTGGTVLANSSGTLVVGSSGALGTGSNALTINAGTLDLRSSASVGAFNGSIGTVVTSGTTGASTLTAGTGFLGSSTYAGTIINGSGTVSLIKAGSGTLTLTNANTYSGSTVVSAGKLALTGTGSIGTGAVSIGNGATLDVGGISGSTYSVSSPLTTTGSGNIVATGKLLTISGITSVGGDSLVGSLAVTGDLTLSGTANFTITGISAGLYDSIAVSGSLTYSSLTIALDTASFVPSGTSNANLQLFSAGSFAGTSFILTGTTLSGGYSWDFSNLATAGYITLVAPTGSALYSWGASGAGGTGTWDNSTANWYDGSSSVVWDSSKLARFAGTAGTVTVSGTVGANSGLEFDTAGYTLQSGTIVLGGPTLLSNTITGTIGTTTINSVLTGTSGFIKAGAGTLVLGGANTYSGTTLINAGTLALGASNVLPDGTDVAINSAVLDIGSFSDTVASVALNSGTIAGTTGVLSASSFTAQSGLISANLGGAGSLTKTSSGTLTLTGSNSYSGGTILSAGELAVGSDFALGTGSLALNGGTFTSADSTARTISNGVVYGADMVLGDLGTGDLNFTGFSDFGGAIRALTIGSGLSTTLSGGYGNGGISKVGAGSLIFASSGTLSSLSISAGAASINAGQTLTLTTSQLALSGGSLAINGTLLSKSTTTWLAPTSGTVTVGAGASIIQQGNGSPTNFLFSSNVVFAPTSTFVFRDYTNAVSVSGRTYGMNVTFDTSGTGMSTGAISGAGTWTVNGDLTIGSHVGFNFGTYTGTTNFNGNVTVQSSGTFGLSVGATGARSFTINSGKTLTADGTILLNSSQAITIASGGTLQGTGSISGTVNINGTFAAGDNGVGTITADALILNSTAQTVMTLTGTNKGVDYGVVNATGLLTTGGTIKITLSGYTPVLGDVFDLFDYDPSFLTDNGVTFDFSGAVLAPGLGWDTTNFTGGLQDGTISVVAIPEPGTLALLGCGLGLMVYRRIRRRA